MALDLILVVRRFAIGQPIGGILVSQSPRGIDWWRWMVTDPDPLLTTHAMGGYHFVVNCCSDMSNKLCVRTFHQKLTEIFLVWFRFVSLLKSRTSHYMPLVALAVIIRPTSAITWFPLCLWHLYMARHSLVKLTKQFALRGYHSLISLFYFDKTSRQ